MDETKATQAPSVADRKERQLVAGRYRLAAFHLSDESTEVWRALDESTKQVATLEFLRDRGPASRDRFLTAARRMAAAEQPSVMKVAAIHDEPDATFIVFEHLVHVPVPLDWLKPVDEPAPILASSAPAVAAPKPEPAVAVAPKPILSVATEVEASAPEATSDGSSERRLDTLVAALRAGEFALIDSALLKESANEIVASVRSAVEDLRLETTLARARELLDRADFSTLGSSLTGAARRMLTVRPRVRIPTPHMPRPAQREAAPARVRTIRIGKTVAAKPRAPREPRAPRVPGRFAGRVRWGRVLSRGLIPALLAAVVIALPAEVLRTVGNELGSLEQRLRAAAAPFTSPTPALRPASFELPPLSAYAASFERQAAYPTARPNDTVEWVVALRNTGSVGWYRGIDGAQASLALADGTTAGVQSTPYVGPGQVGWFVVRFRAPSEPGVHTIGLRPRIDGRGPLPDLGIYATVTVAKNP